MRARIFIAIFLMLTLLPLMQMATGLVPVAPINENRTLAKPPNLSLGLDRMPRLASEWFNDHFGLRPLLIRLKTQIDYSVFRTSDRVLVGKDGWLFYRSTINVELPAVEALLTSSKQDDLADGMKAFTAALQDAGIRTVLTINMMSDRFYGDKLPASALRRTAHPHIDDLVDRFRQIPSLYFVDSTAILRDAAKQREIFHRTDFHWNDPAAYFVGKAIVDTISTAEGLPKSVWTHPFEVTTQRTSGGIATFMPLFVPPSEQALMIKPTYQWPPGVKHQSKVGIYESGTTTDPVAKGLLPMTVFVGDSFLDGMVRSGLQADFEATARVRWRPGIKLSVIAENLPPGTKWCVIQFIEVGMSAIRAFSDRDDVAKAVEILKQRAH